jgi:hypothetical protein
VRRNVAIRRRSSKGKYRGPVPPRPPSAAADPRVRHAPVAGLARDPNPLTRLDRADTSHDQLPVRVLDCQLPLPPRRPIYTPRHAAECCDKYWNLRAVRGVNFRLPLTAGTAKRPVVRSQASGSRSEISSSAADTSLVCQLAETRTTAWQEQPPPRSAERERDGPRIWPVPFDESSLARALRTGMDWSRSCCCSQQSG